MSAICDQRSFSVHSFHVEKCCLQNNSLMQLLHLFSAIKQVRKHIPECEYMYRYIVTFWINENNLYILAKKDSVLRRKCATRFPCKYESMYNTSSLNSFYTPHVKYTLKKPVVIVTQQKKTFLCFCYIFVSLLWRHINKI